MADDLEAFLRQAAQRRAGRKKPEPARSTPSPAPRKPRTAQPRHVDDAVVEIVDAMVMPDETSRLETHVDNASKFAQRAEHLGAEHLGEEVGQADEQLEARLHKKFDHRLGALDDGPGMPALDVPEPEATVASEIAKLLANPDSMRKAIILSEILSPPSDRW